MHKGYAYTAWITIVIGANALIAQYGIVNATTAAPGNELGIFEALNDHYSKKDLDVFFNTLYPYVEPTRCGAASHA